MRPVSDRFLASLRESHLVAATCTLVFPDGIDHEVPIEGGSITIDRTATARRSGSISIPWSLQTEASLGLDLRSLPLGGYALISRGLLYGDGSREEAILGVLRIESVSWETLAASATIELSDRMAQIRDEAFVAPFAAGGLEISAAAVAVVQGVFGDDIEYQVLTGATPVLADVFYSGSRADALAALATAANAVAYFDAVGDFVFAPADVIAEPVWTVDAGERGVMINADEALDRTGIFNGVLVNGQQDGTSPPVTGLATFDDPTSPLRWDGPFGNILSIESNTSAQTPDQALAIAQTLLDARLKQTRQLTLQAAPNPAIEAGDTIRVVFPDGRDELHLIDAVTVDLSTGAQQIQTRSREVPGIVDPTKVIGADVRGAPAWREAQASELILG